MFKHINYFIIIALLILNIVFLISFDFVGSDTFQENSLYGVFSSTSGHFKPLLAVGSVGIVRSENYNYIVIFNDSLSKEKFNNLKSVKVVSLKFNSLFIGNILKVNKVNKVVTDDTIIL
jgi:hypothetical protein